MPRPEAPAVPPHRPLNLLGVLLVTALSIALLCYIGYGEALRTYPKFELDRLSAQAESVAHTMEPFALAGLPLEQFPGFATVAGPLLDSDPSLVAVYVTDARGQVVFAATAARGTGFDPAEPPVFDERADDRTGKGGIGQTDSFYRATLPLTSRLETVGQVHVVMDRSAIGRRIDAAFRWLALAAGAVVAACAAGLLVAARRGRTGAKVTNALYGLAMVVVGGLTIATLVGLQADGIQDKTRALASSLGQRLQAPLELGLAIEDLRNLDVLFRGYRQLDPDISFVALTVGDRVQIDTDPTQVGSVWQRPPGNLGYDLPLAGSTGGAETVLHVGIPASAVYAQLWRSVKNFLVLTAAAGMLSLLFFDLLRCLNRGREGRLVGDGAAVATSHFGVMRLFYFLVVFVDGLSSSFLPIYTQDLAGHAGLDQSAPSAVFTAYFLSFLLVLIPAGRLAQRHGARAPLLIGAALVAASVLTMALMPSFYALALARVIAGGGQGMTMIGVQSFFLGGRSTESRTRGAGIIVFGYNGGLISGAAIGALLAVYMGFQGVFLVGAGAALLLLAYAWLTVPAEPWGVATRAAEEASTGLLTSLPRALRDWEFVKATVLIGMPTKAVLTGVTVFALPLLLARQSYAQEDVGQLVMLYAASVLVSSSYVARLVGVLGRTSNVLFAGALGSGLGLVVIGLAGTGPVTAAPTGVATALLVVGMVVLGVSHGCINAPIVTHIAATPTAEAIGPNGATSLYRFIERIGHVAGPLIVGQVLAVGHESMLAVGWVGGGVAVLGVLFLVLRGRPIPGPTFVVGAQA